MTTTDGVVDPDAAATPSESHAPARLELTAGIGYYYAAGAWSQAQTTFGLVLSEHAVLTAGAGFGFTRPAPGSYYVGGQSWSGSLGARFYTRAPRARGFSPVVQLALSYNARHETTAPSSVYPNELTSHALGGRATAGLAYFVTDELGLLFEAGVQVQGVVATRQTYAPGAGGSLTSDGFSGSSVVQLSVVFRR